MIQQVPDADRTVEGYAAPDVSRVVADPSGTGRCGPVRE